MFSQREREMRYNNGQGSSNLCLHWIWPQALHNERNRDVNEPWDGDERPPYFSSLARDENVGHQNEHANVEHEFEPDEEGQMATESIEIATNGKSLAKHWLHTTAIISLIIALI